MQSPTMAGNIGVLALERCTGHWHFNCRAWASALSLQHYCVAAGGSAARLRGRRRVRSSPQWRLSPDCRLSVPGPGPDFIGHVVGRGRQLQFMIARCSIIIDGERAARAGTGQASAARSAVGGSAVVLPAMQLRDLRERV